MDQRTALWLQALQQRAGGQPQPTNPFLAAPPPQMMQQQPQLPAVNWPQQAPPEPSAAFLNPQVGTPTGTPFSIAPPMQVPWMAAQASAGQGGGMPAPAPMAPPPAPAPMIMPAMAPRPQHVTAPTPAPAAGGGWPSLDTIATQRAPGEPNIIAAPGQAIAGAMVRGRDQLLDNPLVNAVRWAFSNDPKATGKPEAAAPRVTPRQAFGKAAGSGPLKSYSDPRWSGMESDVEKLAGIPPGSLGLIRTRGERSNMDQVSSAGARGVYQITPTTARLIQQKYGFDPLSSPSNMAKGAALILKEGIQRTGSLEGGVRQYIGGTDPSNYGKVTNDYVARVMGGDGSQGSGLMNPFDPSYGNQALAELDQAGAAAMTPISTAIDQSGAPTLAAPIEVAGTDFSKARSALAATRPEEITEKEALQVRRDGWFSGLGQALANLEDGAGLGKVLAAMGGGAMAGGARGNDELRRRRDQFDEKMARYNVAVSNQEMGIAQTAHAEMQHHADALNNYAVQQFTVANDRFFKNNYATITPDGSAIMTSRVGADGKGTLTRTPIKAAVQADIAIRKAQVYQSLGQQSNAARADVARATNGYIVGMAAQQAMTPNASPADESAANVAGMAAMAGDVVATGRVASLFGKNEDEYKGMLKAAQTEVMQVSGLAPGQAGYDDAIQAAVQERVLRFAASNAQFRQELFNNGGSASAVMNARRQAGAKTTVTRGPKGTTTREQY